MITRPVPPLTPAEIAKRDAIFEACKNEDDLGVVLRSQAFIEKLLEDIVMVQSVRPEYFQIMRPRYENKVLLALMLDGMPEKFKETFKVLGKIRNDFAHAPERKFTQKDVSDFVASFPEKIKNFILEKIEREKVERTNFKRRFSICVIALHAYMAGRLRALQEEKTKI